MTVPPSAYWLGDAVYAGSRSVRKIASMPVSAAFWSTRLSDYGAPQILHFGSAACSFLIASADAEVS